MYTHYSAQDVQCMTDSVFQGSGYIPSLVSSLYPLPVSIKTEEFEHHQLHQEEEKEKVHYQERRKKSCSFTPYIEQELLLTSGYYPYENLQSPSSSVASPPVSERNYIRCSSEEYSTMSSPDTMSFLNYHPPSSYDSYVDTEASDITSLQVMLSEQQQQSPVCDMSYFPSSVMGSPCSTSTSLVSSPSSDLPQQQLLSMPHFDFYQPHPQHQLTNAGTLQKYDLNTFYHNPYFLFDATPTAASAATTTSTDAICGTVYQQKKRTLKATPCIKGNRPYSCQVCASAFARKHDLQRHIRGHTGEKPYSCACCKKAFARSDALKRHLRVEDQCRSSREVQAMKETGRRCYKNL